MILEDSLSVCRSFAASSSDATLPTPTFEIKIQRIDGSSQRVDVSADMRPDFFRSWGTGTGLQQLTEWTTSVKGFFTYRNYHYLPFASKWGILGWITARLNGDHIHVASFSTKTCWAF